MLQAIGVGLVVFVLLILGIGALPMPSAPALALDGLGLGLFDLGRGLADLVQLPVTVSIYVTGRHGSLASVQGAAVQDRAMWLAAVLFWAMLALLARQRDSSR